MKFHPYVAVMKGSQAWNPVLRFSSSEEGEAETGIAPTAANSTDNSNGSRRLSMFQLEIILVLGLFLILSLLTYMALLYTKRAGRPSNQSTTATAPTATRPRGRGVDRSVVETFPVIGYATVKMVRTSKSPLDCAICLSEFVDDNILRLLPGCRHVFHADCIDAWLENHVTCPVCRSNLSDPEVRAGKRLLSMNSEFEDFESSPAISEHEPTSDTDGPTVKGIRRARSITEGWGRFTLALPEQVFNEIEVAGKHRRSASVQDYTFQGKASWRDGKLHAFLKSFSRNGQGRGDDMSTVAEGVEASVSTAESTQRLTEPSLHGDTPETENTGDAVDLTDLPVHERV